MKTSAKHPRLTQDATIESFKKDYLHVISLDPIEVKCLACMSDVTYQGKISIRGHTSNNSHQKAKAQMVLQDENNKLRLSNQHFQVVNQSLENKLEFSKREVRDLIKRIEELKNEKTSLLNRIAGMDPNQFDTLETNVKNLCQAIKLGMTYPKVPKTKLHDNAKLLKLFKKMQNEQNQVKQQDLTQMYKQFQLHQQNLDTQKTLQAQQIKLVSEAVERIENNLNGCSNQGQVLSAVQEMASKFETEFETKLNEIKPIRNPDDDETSDDDGVYLENLKFAHSSKAWFDCSSMRRIKKLLTSQSDYMRENASPQFSDQMAHLMEIKRNIDQHSVAQHKFKMKALADLLAENPDQPKIWIIYQLNLRFITQYRKLGPVFRVLGSHFKKLHLDRLLEDLRPLIQNALEEKNQRLSFKRKAEATGKSIEDVMNDFNGNNDHEEVETDPEDQDADREKKQFKKMVKKQLQDYFRRYRPWEEEELNKMWDKVYKHHAYARCLFRWYLVTGSRHQDAFDITYQMFYDALEPDINERKQLQIRDRKTFKPFQRVYMFPEKLIKGMKADLKFLQQKYEQKLTDFVFGSTNIKKKHHNWFNHNVQVIWGDSSTVNSVKPHHFHRFRSTATRIMRNNNDGTLTVDRINQYFGWGADAKNCAKFYDSTLPKKTTLALAEFMDKFEYPTVTEDIDRCKEIKFDEFIRVYLQGGDPAPKIIPNSARSVLAKNRSLKLQQKLYQCDMQRLPKHQKLSYEEWKEQGGLKKYIERVNQLNEQRRREGKNELKYTE